MEISFVSINSFPFNKRKKLTLKIVSAASTGIYMKYIILLWPPLEAGLSVSKRIKLTELNISGLTNIAILSPRKEDCTEINYLILNTLNHNYSRTCYIVDCGLRR
jgi:hypothetical protein